MRQRSSRVLCGFSTAAITVTDGSASAVLSLSASGMAAKGESNSSASSTNHMVRSCCGDILPSSVVHSLFVLREPDGAATGFIETAGAAEQQIGFAASACANHGDVAVSYVKECGGDEYTVVAQSKGTWCHASRCGAVKSSLPACGASGAENKGGLVVPLNADAVLMACTKESMSWTALQRKGTVR